CRSSASMRGSRYHGEGNERARASGRPGSNSASSSSSEGSTRWWRLPVDGSPGEGIRGRMATPVTVADRPAPDVQAAPTAPGLLRSLGTLDGALITIGATVGSGIFLTTGDIARLCPQPALILGLWAAGGLFALAGALAYGELGAMFPRAGGQYPFPKHAYGPLWGFLFGWTSFLVIMTGGVAAIAVGFGEYLGAFVPSLGSGVELLSVKLPGVTWSVTRPQLTAAVSVLALTAVNWLGVREGASV